MAKLIPFFILVFMFLILMFFKVHLNPTSDKIALTGACFATKKMNFTACDLNYLLFDLLMYQ